LPTRRSVHERVDEGVDGFLVVFRKAGPLAALQGCNHVCVQPLAACETRMGAPFMAGFPGNRDDQYREFEQPLSSLVRKRRRFSDGGPMSASAGLWRKALKRPGQIALVVDQRTARFCARTASDGIVKLFLFGRELLQSTAEEPAHSTPKKSTESNTGKPADAVGDERGA